MTTFKAVIFSMGALVVCYYSFSFYKNWEMEKNYFPPFYDDGVCNVAVVSVGGEIGISKTDVIVGDGGISESRIAPLGDVDRIIYDLEYAKNSPAISAVILQIDSFGGSISASETLYNYLLNYKSKPIVSVMRDAGISGAYLISLPTNRIFAGRTTAVGSIGVTSSGLNMYEKNKKDGVEYVEISSGKLKDGLTGDKKINKEILEYEQGQVERLAKIFKDWVSFHRKIPIEVVDRLADGRSWIGEEAFKLGLIDEIGGTDNALNYLGNSIGANVPMLPCLSPKI